MADADGRTERMIGRLGQRLMKSERWRQWYEKGLDASQARTEHERARLAQAFADAPRNVSWTVDVGRSEHRHWAGEMVLHYGRPAAARPAEPGAC